MPTIAQEAPENGCLSPVIGIPGASNMVDDDEYDDDDDAIDASDNTRILNKSRDRSRHLSKR